MDTTDRYWTQNGLVCSKHPSGMECHVNEIELGSGTDQQTKTIHVRLKNIEADAGKVDIFVSRDQLKEFTETINFLGNYLFQMLNETSEPKQSPPIR